MRLSQGKSKVKPLKAGYNDYRKNENLLDKIKKDSKNNKLSGSTLSDTQKSSTQMSDTQKSSTQMSDTQKSSTQMSDTQKSSTQASNTQKSSTQKVATQCETLLSDKNMLALTDLAINARLTSAQIRFLKYVVLNMDWNFGKWTHFSKSKTMKDLGVGPTQLKRLQDHFIEREIIEKSFRKTNAREGKVGGQKGLHYKINKSELIDYLK